MPTMKSKFNVNEKDVPSAKVRHEDGWREVNIKFLLTEKNVGSQSAVLYKALIKFGASHGKHIHRNADELVYIISGNGRHGQGDEEWDIGAGDSYFVPRGMVHWAFSTDANDPLDIIGAYIGAGSFEKTGYEFVE